MHSPTLLHYTWLHCTKKRLADGEKCRQPSLVVADFEKQVTALIDQFVIPEGFSKWAITWLQRLNETEVKQRTVVNDNLQYIHNDVQKHIDDLLDLRLKGLIDYNEYQKKKELLLLEKQEVNQELQKTDQRADDWLELYEQTFNFATYAHIWFRKGTTEQKRAILKALGSNLTLTDKILSIRQYEPWIILTDMKEKYQTVLEAIEPEDSIDLTIQKCGSETTISSLLPSRDSNPNRQIQILSSYH